MNDQSDRQFKLVSYHDDQPTERPGSLIPRPKREIKPYQKTDFHPLGALQSVNVAPIVGATFGAVALFLLALIGTASYGLVISNQQVASPAILIVDPYTHERTELSYGPQTALTQNNFFTDTRDALIEEQTTFVEVDVPASQLRYFKRGVLLQSAEIVSVGKEGSWWSVPAGLYTVEQLEKNEYSNLAQASFPYAIRFGGNYVIHGAPEYPGGSIAEANDQIGGIRLSDRSAEQLYRSLESDVTILVHTLPKEADSFVYEAGINEVRAAQYLIADVENGTVLAAEGMDEVVPIASITKLMTAVIAAEEIDLDARVRSSAPSFVESLIPRLADRQSVSVYSLMQLLLVESSNEAAEVIAAQIGRVDFVNLMNKKAAELGMYDTTFTDPSGVSAGNISTVRDLLTLTQYINNERSFIFEITDANRVTTDYVGDEFSDLVNFNKIEEIDSFVGGKVGETTAAGQTSISLHNLTVQQNSRLLSLIVLGSEDRNEDVQALLNFIETTFTTE